MRAILSSRLRSLISLISVTFSCDEKMFVEQFEFVDKEILGLGGSKKG